MFGATILRIDDSVILEFAEVQGQNSKRGDGYGHVWRGVFAVPPQSLRPTMGETICLRLVDNSRIAGVVTEVEGQRVHFRARGRAPIPAPEGAVTVSTQPCGSGR